MTRNIRHKINKDKILVGSRSLLEENKISFSKEPETDLLIDEEETGLLLDENETILLEDTIEESSERNKGMPIRILDEVILVHTNEVIR